MTTVARGMKIGELARRTGASVRALRHYEAEGLITAVRGANGYREFTTDTVAEVTRIRRLIDSGLPTRLIREILPYLNDPADILPQVPCDYLLDEVGKQREAFDRRIAQLVRNRDSLDRYLHAARLTLTQESGS